MTKEIKCTLCKGTGKIVVLTTDWVDGNDWYRTIVCVRCDGSGVIEVNEEEEE